METGQGTGETPSVSIKELQELMKGLELISVGAAKIGKDKKIGADDLAVLLDLFKNVETFKDAFTGLGDLPAEVKDLREDEILALVMGVFSIVSKVKEALK